MFEEKSTEEIINLVDDSQLEKEGDVINRTVENVFKANRFVATEVDVGSGNSQQNLNAQTDSFDVNIKNNEITINAKKKENHTLEDLKQKIINDLYSMKSYESNEVELIKILFDCKANNNRDMSHDSLIKSVVENKKSKSILTINDDGTILL